MKYKINVNGRDIVCEGAPYLIIGEPIKQNENTEDLSISVSQKTQEYDTLYYTTSVETLKLILTNYTIRCSSLTYANLNDKMEQNRVGVSQFAGSRYITCFSHCNRENVWFWSMYGGDDKTKRVMLKFDNFSRKIREKIHFDYCMGPNGKKCLFRSPKCNEIINRNGVLGKIHGLANTHIDYDTRTIVDNVQVFDIDYIPADSDEFKEDHSGEAEVSFSEKSGIMAPTMKIKSFDPTCLGKQKSDPWSTEEETRIMCCLANQEFNEWDYIDLRLKNEMFRDLTIILNPWADDILKRNILSFIDKWDCDEDIKNSISTVDSFLKGTVNF